MKGEKLVEWVVNLFKNNDEKTNKSFLEADFYTKGDIEQMKAKIVEALSGSKTVLKGGKKAYPVVLVEDAIKVLDEFMK